MIRCLSISTIIRCYGCAHLCFWGEATAKTNSKHCIFAPPTNQTSHAVCCARTQQQQLLLVNLHQRSMCHQAEKPPSKQSSEPAKISVETRPAANRKKATSRQLQSFRKTVNKSSHRAQTQDITANPPRHSCIIVHLVAAATFIFSLSSAELEGTPHALPYSATVPATPMQDPSLAHPHRQRWRNGCMPMASVAVYLH